MNNVKRLLDLTKDSGKFELDDNGYVSFIPSETELAHMNRKMRERIEKAIKEHEPLFREAAENIKTYRASKTRIDGDEAILPLPLAAIAADQIISWTYNTIMRPRPIFSIDAYFKDEYEVAVPMDVPMMRDMGVMGGMPGDMGMMGGGMGGGMMGGGPPVPPPMGGPMGPMMTVPMPLKKDSEEIARRLEQGLEFKVRERLNFGKLVQNVVSDVVIGSKGYVKVCADKSTRSAFQPTVDGIQLDLDDKNEYSLSSKEMVKWYCLPVFNVLKLNDDDENPEWAEKISIEPDTFTARVKSGEYNLIKKEEAEKLSTLTTEVKTHHEESADRAKGKDVDDPKKALEIYEIQFDWIVKAKDEDGVKKVKKVRLLGDYHYGAGQFCYLKRNPYDHQRSFIVPFYQIQDAHSDTGTCTVGRLKWHQRVATHFIQSESKNSFHANNFSYWYEEGSPTADYAKAGGKVRSGEWIPGKLDEDWGIVRPGEGFQYSMLPLIQWTEGSGQRTSNVSSYEQGDAVPGRTPAATVSQILQQGLQQPLMFLRTLNDAFVKVVRLYLETARQYQPFGETLPIRDPETKQIIEIPFRFPIAAEGVDPLDNFRIALTASDESLAKEHDETQVMMSIQAWERFANFTAQVAGPLVAAPNATPALAALGEKIISAGQTLMTKYMALQRVDEDKFDLTKEIDALLQEKQAMAAMQAQMGGMSAGQPAAAGQGVPGPTGPPNGGGPPGAGAEPGVPADGAPPPEAGVPGEATF